MAPPRLLCAEIIFILREHIKLALAFKALQAK